MTSGRSAGRYCFTSKAAGPRPNTYNAGKIKQTSTNPRPQPDPPRFSSRSLITRLQAMPDTFDDIRLLRRTWQPKQRDCPFGYSFGKGERDEEDCPANNGREQ